MSVIPPPQHDRAVFIHPNQVETRVAEIDANYLYFHAEILLPLVYQRRTISLRLELAEHLYEAGPSH